MMSPPELESLLRREIPLARAMQVHVAHLDLRAIQLQAPLPANRNPHGSAFGGSIVTSGILSGWALLHPALSHCHLSCHLVVASNSIDSLRPLPNDLSADWNLPDSAGWDAHVSRLKQSGSAILELMGTVGGGGVVSAQWRGRFHASCRE